MIPIDLDPHTLREALMGQVAAMIRVDEGFRGQPYPDPITGHITVGYGRNLDANPISIEEGEVLLRNDINKAIAHCELFIAGFDRLSLPRRAVLVDMAFQMGIGGLLAFKKMLAAIRDGDFTGAVEEMADSKWFREQTPNRVNRLAAIMREDKFPDRYGE